MDIWGWCHDCARWFPCQDWFDPKVAQPCCPGCGSEPSAIENRAAGRRVLAQLDEVA